MAIHYLAEFHQVVGGHRQLARAREHGGKPDRASRMASSRSSFIALRRAASGRSSESPCAHSSSVPKPDVTGDVDGDALALQCVEVAAQCCPA